MKPHFAMLAAYNGWANRRLYDAVMALPPDAWHADHGAFFGSFSGTLNHLVVTDRIWLHRLTGTGPLQTRLDEVLTDDLTLLRPLREAEDRRIADYVDGLDEMALAGKVTYQPVSRPIDITQPRASILAHLFNHQTHHRGQAHALITAAGERTEATDLWVIV